MCECSSLWCELDNLADDDTIIIEFADSSGQTLSLTEASPRIAEKIIYDWCLQNLT